MTTPSARYVELRCQSGFSFLRGTSQPEELVTAAAGRGYGALALTDRCGLYGAARFMKAAERAGLQPILGSELTIDGYPLLLLCENAVGYRHLCRLISAQRRRMGTGPQGALSEADLQPLAAGLIAIVGGPECMVAAALDNQTPPRPGAAQSPATLDPARVEKTLLRLQSLFGRQSLFLELQVHFEREEDRRNLAMMRLASRHGIPLIASNDTRTATQDGALLCDALDCVRQGTTLRQAGTRLPRNGERYLKSPADMVALFADVPQALASTLDIAARCRFSARDLGYRFPDYPVPDLPVGDPEAAKAAQLAFLRARVFEAAPSRFQPYTDRARAQLDRELVLIAKLGLCGYFLIVWDIIELCRARGILAQGRGSAANSAVCYALGITACDPLKMDLLFERFLSEERGEWPDIDLDLPSGAAREEIIQHLYRKYGPHGCAMTGSVITYRGRSAVRDLGKVLELPGDAIDRLAKSIGHYEDPRVANSSSESSSASSNPQGAQGTLPERAGAAGLSLDHPDVARFLRLWTQLQDLPRHFAQHPGGMVIAAGRLDEVVPLEPAAMPGRLVMQWDKDDCEDLGIVKIDLLGLGMLAALSEARELVPLHTGKPFDLHTLPSDDAATYDLIARGDTVGVFQIESRAQMAILPRTRPRSFYDLVVQVGLIRPGPIIGDMVHPYLRRRSGRDPVTYVHPSLEPVLARTLGIPLFQEQIMRVAMIAGGFTGGQADELRRAMGGKHGVEKMQRMVAALRAGMRERGIVGPAADEIVQSITAFAAYGFPESHAISFAYLTYASAYLKAHHPAAFFASLLNAWPMGFYHPATLVKDAQRHGVRVLPIAINESDVRCTLTEHPSPTSAPGQAKPSPGALRIGLRYVRGLSQAAGEALVAARKEEPFHSIGDVRRRVSLLSPRDLSTLAELGAFARLDGQPSRRSALWQVSAMGDKDGLLSGSVTEETSPLAEMSLAERVAADYHGASLSVGPHPVALLRKQLAEQGILTAQEAMASRHGLRLRAAGLCIVRQRPPTAKGFCFLTLEDESGLLNVILPPAVYEAHATTLRSSSLLLVEGMLQRQDGAVSLKADSVAGL
jgi:error-prone DNA polymerase